MMSYLFNHKGDQAHLIRDCGRYRDDLAKGGRVSWSPSKGAAEPPGAEPLLNPVPRQAALLAAVSFE
jgi:hypothetical protein